MDGPNEGSCLDSVVQAALPVQFHPIQQKLQEDSVVLQRLLAATVGYWLRGQLHHCIASAKLSEQHAELGRVVHLHNGIYLTSLGRLLRLDRSWWRANADIVSQLYDWYV